MSEMKRHPPSGSTGFILEINALKAQLANAADEIIRLRDERDAMRNVIDDIRDSVLNERNHLAEAGLDCDQINAVLANIDDECAAIPEQPKET